MSTDVPWKETCNNVLCKPQVALCSELRTARKTESKYSFHGSVEDGGIVSSVRSFYDCTSISEPIIIGSEYLANWWISLECIETRKGHYQVEKEGTHSATVCIRK